MERPRRAMGHRPPSLLTVGGAVGLVASAVVVGWLFLAPFLSGRATTPFGFDTPHYIWRSNLVIAEGLGSLGAIDPALNTTPHADRPAYPVFATLASHVAGIDPSTLAYVVPAVFAVVIGLAGGGFALEVLEEPAWALPVYVVLLGASLFVVRTAVGSIDNLMVDGVLVAGAAATMLFAARRRGGAAAVALFVAAFFIHWIFLGLFLLLLLGVALVLLPSSLRAGSGGMRLTSTPSSRILAVALGSAGAALAAFLATPGFATTTPVLPVESIEAKMAARIPGLRLPIGGALAACGALALWWPRSALRRSGLALLGLWALSVPVSLLAYRLVHHRLAAYRVAEFALAIPLLAAAALVGLTRLGWARYRVAGAAVGVAAIAAGLVLTLVAGSHQWDQESGIMLPDRVQQVATAATYLRSVKATGPVVFVISTPFFIPADRVIRAGLPGSLLASVRVFNGRSQDLLAGRPTTRPNGPPDVTSASAWPAVREILDKGYIAIYLSAFNPAYQPPPGATSVAPGVWVVKGPAPSTPITSAPAPDPDPRRLASSSLALLLFMGVAGLGWTASLLDAGWLARVAFAPAVGAAALALATLPMSHIDGPTGSAGAWIIYLTIAAGGWVALAIMRRVGSRVRPTPP